MPDGTRILFAEFRKLKFNFNSDFILAMRRFYMYSYFDEKGDFE